MRAFLAGVLACLLIVVMQPKDTSARDKLFSQMEDGSYLILTPMTNCVKEKVCGYNAHKVDPEKVGEFIK